MEIKTSVDYLKSKRCADVYTESETDYVLPDYLGDVRKILFTEASLRPSGRFAGGETVDFSGIVVYNVIYLDGTGDICSVEFSSDYDYSVKCSGEAYNDSIADTRVANYTIRLIGPRKINAKASLVGSVQLCESESIETLGDCFVGEYTPEINRGSVEIRASKTSSVCEREYALSLARLDGAIADEVSVVYFYAEPTVEEIYSEENRVCVKGKISMFAVIKNGDEPAYCIEKSTPYDENVDFEGVTPSMTLIPELTVSSLRQNVNADETGCEIVLSGIVECCVIGESNQSVDLILDGYLKEAPTENSYTDFNYSRLVDAVTQRNSVSAEMNRVDMESEGLREIVFLTSTPKVESVEAGDGFVNIVGEIRYSGIASEMIGNDISYTGIKFTSPFSQNVNINCQNDDNIRVETEIHTENTSAMLDADKIYASCNLECRVVVIAEESKRILSVMSRGDGEGFESDGAKITVYYPAAEDTLFSVAKRFHTSSLKVARDNGITEAVFASDNPTGSLAGVKKIIIY